ncbi:MAG: ABC transporter permease [Ginsengibacter sp.]
MFKNYFKTAWRNLMKNKTFSLINIAGLSIGMAACLLILQYVSFQLSFDQFNKNASDIYRVVNDRYQNGKLIQHGTITYSAIGKAMQDDFPEVVDHTRAISFDKEIIQFNNKRIGDLTILAVDNSFLRMFSYPLVAGDARTALQEPRSLILSQKVADKLFGVSDDYGSLVGKEVTEDIDSLPYKITGILKDVPGNSHLQFDILLSYVTLYSGATPWKDADYSFTDSDFWHYIQLKHGANYKALEAKLPAFSQRHFQGNKVSGSIEKFYLQPLSKAHLYSDFEYEIGKTASATVVWGLLIIAVLIIIIAWINYINLSTAKSMERAKEVGVRKVSGATRQQLIRQFLTESLLINIIAFFLALVLVFVLQPFFNQLIHHQLSLSYLFVKGLNGFSISAALIAIFVAGIFVSGFYPAIVLSAFKPIAVLKGKFVTSRRGIVLRKILVVGQFAVSVALMIGSFVVYKQMQYVSDQNLGFNMSQMLILKPPLLTKWDSSFISKQNAFIEEVKQLPHVSGAAYSWRLPGDEWGRNFNVRRKDAQNETNFAVRNMGISADYINVYQIKLLAGSNFETTDYNVDWDKLHSVILNQTAVRLLGFKSPKDAIGKQIIQGDQTWDIKGVIADFHEKSLKYAIEPAMFYPATNIASPFSIKVDATDLSSTVAALKKKYDSFFPNNIFDYFFLDEKFNQQYADDELFGKVFAIFSGFAIFIACLGLLGLSLFATAQRTKEIGIRKVLGASVSNIAILLSTGFIKLVLLAFVIASPIAWYLMNNWLHNYAYRMNISWWIFLAAGSLAVMIALATICFQAIKAAKANPVKNLRME